MLYTHTIVSMRLKDSGTQCRVAAFFFQLLLLPLLLLLVLLVLCCSLSAHFTHSAHINTQYGGCALHISMRYQNHFPHSNEKNFNVNLFPIFVLYTVCTNRFVHSFYMIGARRCRRLSQCIGGVPPSSGCLLTTCCC